MAGTAPARYFRVLAAHVPSIDNNLSMANVSFDEFASLADEAGVFRGLPGI